jgi:hypothetical protein
MFVSLLTGLGTAAWPILKTMLFKLMAQSLVEKVAIEVLEFLSTQTTNTVDDAVVKHVKDHFNK